MSGKRLTLTKLSNGSEVELVKNVTSIGRQYDCDIQLTEGYPSRKHAQLIIENDAIFIEDMRSANGTYVNGARITARTRLSGGDRIRFHIEEFKFNADLGFGEPEPATPERAQPPDQATIWANPTPAKVLNVSDAAPNLGGMKSLFSSQNVASEALQSMSADQAVPNVQTIPSNESVDVGDSTVIERLAPAAGVQTVFRKVEEPKPVARPAPAEPASASRTIFRSVVEETRTPPPPQAASSAAQPARPDVVQPAPVVRPVPVVRPQPVIRSENRTGGGVSQQFVAAAPPEAAIASVLAQPEPLAPDFAAVAVSPSAAAMPAEAVALGDGSAPPAEEPIIAERLSERVPARGGYDRVEPEVGQAAPRGPSSATPAQTSADEAAKLVVAASSEAARRPGAWADPAAFLNDANRTKFIDPAALKALVTEGPSLGVLAGAGSSVSSPHLFVASGSQSGTKIQLLAGPSGRQEWTIGSEPDREVVLSDSGVSALHAKLINEGERWKLIDQMSANGTFVNSKRSNVSFLSAGDRVRFGPVECVFQAPRSGVNTEGVFGNRRYKMIAVAVVVAGIGAACLFTLL